MERYMEKINDSRLTPTMQRIRSGSNQLFRETDPNNRTFINEKNADVILKHDRKEMYAELVEGNWYWVSGCAECNGKERDWMTYIECEEHDRCSVCHTNRKDIEGNVWGGKKGWTCNSCRESERRKTRKEAFDKLGSEEPDTLWKDEIICPHCGSELSSSDLYESSEIDCHVCDGEIYLEVEYSVTYSTRVKGERVTC